jgi:hypothetical protein
MVRYVTAGVIDLNICTYVPQGHLTSQTKLWSNPILALATRGPKPLMAGSSPNLYHGYI